MQTVIDRATALDDIAELLFKAELIDGRHAFVRSFTINTPLAPMTLLPEDATVDRCVTTAGGVVVVARCGLGTFLISAYPRSVIVSVASASEALVSSMEEAVRRRIPAESAPDTAAIRTWHTNARGVCRTSDRRISAPLWSAIRRNYPGTVRKQLDQLASVGRPVGGAKLILWHGEPGTGKTTALRSLLREWEPWCAGQYIADPERFFGDPGYISEVLTRPTPTTTAPTLWTAGAPESVWRLIIAEDSDEYLRASARRDAGVGLGRLLNLTDGVLGQGFNTLILLTTNEELHRIHPALTRPGRCLARIEFEPFSPTESREWLPAGIETPERAMSLAELYELSGDVARIGQPHPEPELIGQYL